MPSRYQWVNVTMSAAFPPRDGAGALVHDNRMWLIGGWSRDTGYYPRVCANDVWCSSDGEAWQCVKPNTFLDENFDASADWEGRHCPGFAVAAASRSCLPHRTFRCRWKPTRFHRSPIDATCSVSMNGFLPRAMGRSVLMRSLNVAAG